MEKIQKYSFGSEAFDGYANVSADTEYSERRGYGLLGLSDGYKLDRRVDGFLMAKGCELTQQTHFPLKAFRQELTNCKRSGSIPRFV